MKENKKTICYPGSSFPAQKKRRSSPLIAFLILLLITVCCIWVLQPYYGLDRIMAEDSDIMHYDSAILPVSTATYAPAQAPFEIPLLVNEKNPLPDDYGPRDLISLDAIETNLFILKSPGIQVDRTAAEALLFMLEAAHADGISIWQISEGYRSIDAQKQIWNEKYEKYKNVNGLSDDKALEAVKRRVASPGCSEHHTGLALDITVPGESFPNTKQSKWLEEHCHEYGFVIRYTAEKEHITGITEEPWHIRYVGLEAAKMMKEENWCLEEYIQNYCKRFM